MGNCVFKAGFGEANNSHEFSEVVRVVTPSGGVMELSAPVTADAITTEFPGHAIFRNRDIFSPPLLHTDGLRPGPQPYYLLPLNPYRTAAAALPAGRGRSGDGDDAAARMTPYRMSCEGRAQAADQRPEVVPRYNGGGVWKVRLVISPRELSDILSQEARTGALIESVRTVAKCGGRGRGGGGASSVASSDQWSTVSSSSWKGL